MVIIGTYMGLDGSLGYEKGKTYILKIKEYNDGIKIIPDDHKAKDCTYTSFAAFLTYWVNVSKYDR